MVVETKSNLSTRDKLQQLGALLKASGYQKRSMSSWASRGEHWICFEMEGRPVKGTWAAKEVWGFQPAEIGGGHHRTLGIVQKEDRSGRVRAHCVDVGGP